MRLNLKLFFRLLFIDFFVKKALMKKLKLSISFLDSPSLTHKYVINLPDRRTLYFKSKRKAEDFIRSFGKFVADTIRSSFDIHVSLYSIYLQTSFSMPSYESNDLRRSLDGFLEICGKWSENYGEGWQSMKLDGFFRILNHIEDSALKLKTYFKIKKDYFHVNKVDSHLQMVSFFYEKYDQIFSAIKTDLKYKKNSLRVLNEDRAIG